MYVIVAAIQVIDVVITQNASEALNGGFAITFMNHTTAVLPYDATPEEVHMCVNIVVSYMLEILQINEALLQAVPDIGSLTIWIDGPLSHDKYQKFCLGRRIIVRFDSLPGDQPLLVINQTHLSGDRLQVMVYEVIIAA